MWLEIKEILTGVGTAFILVGVVLIPGLTIVDMLIVFMGVSMFVMGDILIGYQITTNEIKPQMDRTPPGMELTIFQEINGKIHFRNTKKDMMGLRKWRWHNREAACINDGLGMFTLPNGNRGFFSHESYDKSINLILCSALDKIAKETDSRNIQEIYENTMKKLAEKQKEDVHIG
jgi:hypothetical protein